MKSKVYFPFLCLFILCSIGKAQVVEQMIANYQKSRNMSYNSTTITKDFFSDKLYFDTVKSIIGNGSNQLTYRITGKSSANIYDGGKVFSLQFSDSTYRISSNPEQSAHYYESLPYIINRLEDNLKKGKKIIQLKDSIINGKSYFHLKLKESDTIKNDKHVFSKITLLIDKKTNMLYYYRNDSKGFIDGTKTYLTVFNEYRFKNYSVDAKNIEDLTKILLPPYFTLEKPKTEIPLLAKGVTMPEISLYSLNGETIPISAFRGRVLLLNFTVNGCPHCVEAIETLNKLHKQFKPIDFAIITINQSDNREAILKYNKNFDVKYNTYSSDNTALKKYSVQAYPLFYIVDKSGNVSNAHSGFSSEIGEQMTKELKQLLQ